MLRRIVMTEVGMRKQRKLEIRSSCGQLYKGHERGVLLARCIDQAKPVLLALISLLLVYLTGPTWPW